MSRRSEVSGRESKGKGRGRKGERERTGRKEKEEGREEEERGCEKGAWWKETKWHMASPPASLFPPLSLSICPLVRVVLPPHVALPPLFILSLSLHLTSPPTHPLSEEEMCPRMQNSPTNHINPRQEGKHVTGETKDKGETNRTNTVVQKELGTRTFASRVVLLLASCHLKTKIKKSSAY